MGSLAIAVLQSTLVKMKYCSALLVLAFATYVQAGQWVYVEDINDHLRVRRSPQEEPLRYAPAPPVPIAYAEDQSLAGSPPTPNPTKAALDPCTLLLRLTLRPTSNGESVMLLVFNMANRILTRRLMICPRFH